MFKRPALLLLCAICLASLPACATSEMISRAQGQPGPMDPPDLQPPPPMPAYYALVPLVLPFDAVAWPIQLAMGYRP
jgi:hypothetical protein